MPPENDGAATGSTAAAPNASTTNNDAGATGAAAAVTGAEGNTGAATGGSQTSANTQAGTTDGGQGAQAGNAASTTAAAPEKYELKLPQASKLDATDVAAIEAYAKDKKLSQADAQAQVDLANKIVDARFEALQTEHAARVAQWAEDVKADKEIGGEVFARNAELARRVVTKYGDETLLKGLNESGYGNHPALVKMFARIGKAMGEDQLVVGNQGGGKPDPASVLFPNQGKT